jgi:nitroreductase
MTGAHTFNMPLGEAMTTQRAIRRLKPDPVPDELICDLIELAIHAPSGSNAQGWEFIVVKDRTVVAALARQNRAAWHLYQRFLRKKAIPDPKRSKIRDAVQWQTDHFEQIPAIVVACLKGRYLPFYHFAATSYFGSIFPAVQNLLLAARAVNLGATLITIPLWNLFAIRKILGLPGRVAPCALIPLGWPMGAYGATSRKPVESVISYDRYGNRREQA